MGQCGLMMNVMVGGDEQCILCSEGDIALGVSNEQSRILVIKALMNC